MKVNQQKIFIIVTVLQIYFSFQVFFLFFFHEHWNECDRGAALKVLHLPDLLPIEATPFFPLLCQTVALVFASTVDTFDFSKLACTPPVFFLSA